MLQQFRNPRFRAGFFPSLTATGVSMLAAAAALFFFSNDFAQVLSRDFASQMSRSSNFAYYTAALTAPARPIMLRLAAPQWDASTPDEIDLRAAVAVVSAKHWSPDLLYNKRMADPAMRRIFRDLRRIQGSVQLAHDQSIMSEALALRDAVYASESLIVVGVLVMFLGSVGGGRPSVNGAGTAAGTTPESAEPASATR
jgi:hypothetical protein